MCPKPPPLLLIIITLTLILILSLLLRKEGSRLSCTRSLPPSPPPPRNPRTAAAAAAVVVAVVVVVVADSQFRRRRQRRRSPERSRCELSPARRRRWPSSSRSMPGSMWVRRRVAARVDPFWVARTTATLSSGRSLPRRFKCGTWCREPRPTTAQLKRLVANRRFNNLAPLPLPILDRRRGRFVRVRAAVWRAWRGVEGEMEMEREMEGMPRLEKPRG